MQIDQLQVVLRPRTSWEAMELGTALVRQSAGLIWRAWLLFTLPVFLLSVFLALWLDNTLFQLLSLLLLWWLKPWFDRIPLYILSRAVFGERPTLRQCLLAPLHFGRRTLAGDLTWRRLSPYRSLLLPVNTLEGLSGAALRQRRHLLAAQSTHTVRLTLLSMHFEILLYLTLLVLGVLFIPADYLEEVWDWIVQLFSDSKLVSIFFTQAAYWLAMSIMEPFYVGAGFGLYLNRRTWLEAWDIELAFRRLSHRLKASQLVVTTCFTLLLIGMTAGLSPSVQAASGQPVPEATASEKVASGKIASEKVASEKAAFEENAASEKTVPQAASTSPAVARDTQSVQTPTSELDEKLVVPAINKTDETAFDPSQVILRPLDPAFDAAVDQAYRDRLLRSYEQTSRWEKINPDKPAPENNDIPAWLKWLLRLLDDKGESGQEMAGLIIKSLLTLIALILLLAGSWWIYRNRHLLRGHAVTIRKKPATSQIATVAADQPLTADWQQRIRHYWQAGQQREALSLLYQVTVRRLSELSGQPVAAEATEADCLRQLEHLSDQQQAAQLRTLIVAWQRAAYADRFPDQSSFEALTDQLVALHQQQVTA